MHQTNIDEAISLITGAATISGNLLPVSLICCLLAFLCGLTGFILHYAETKHFADSLSNSTFMSAIGFIFSFGILFAIFSLQREEIQMLKKNITPSNTFYIHIGNVEEKDFYESGIHVVSGKVPENLVRNINYLTYHIVSLYCDKDKASCKVFFKAENNDKTIYDVDLKHLAIKLLAEKPLQNISPLNSNASEKAAFTSSSLFH